MTSSYLFYKSAKYITLVAYKLQKQKTEQIYSNSKKCYLSLKKCRYLDQKFETMLTSAKNYAPF